MSARSPSPPLLQTEDLEKQPLLPKAKDGGIGAKRKSINAFKPGNTEEDWDKNRAVLDAMTYRMTDLISWKAFFIVDRTQWAKKNAWIMLAKLMGVSAIFAAGVLVTLHDPSELRTSKFSGVAKFLNVFVGLLLGFFMSSSMHRWWACANGFLELFDAIRNLQMQLFALGVPTDKNMQVVRYGMVSAKLLAKGLHVEALPPAERAAKANEMWLDLIEGYETEHVVREDDSDGAESGDGTPRISPRRRKCMAVLTTQELNILKSKGDPSEMMWIWVASLIGRMAQDGIIPPMPSPTYGRIMNLAQDAHSSIVKVRANITVQAPFIYMHMLCSLVHINNIINAISFGITLGAMIGTYVMHHHNEDLPPDARYMEAADEHDLVRDSENLVIAFFFSVVGPFLYQALLEVSVTIAQPFASCEGAIPTDRLIRTLELDLKEGYDMSEKLPGWQAPSFRESQK